MIIAGRLCRKETFIVAENRPILGIGEGSALLDKPECIGGFFRKAAEADAARRDLRSRRFGNGIRVA